MLKIKLCEFTKNNDCFGGVNEKKIKHFSERHCEERSNLCVSSTGEIASFLVMTAIIIFLLKIKTLSLSPEYHQFALLPISRHQYHHSALYFVLLNSEIAFPEVFLSIVL